MICASRTTGLDSGKFHNSAIVGLASFITALRASFVNTSRRLELYVAVTDWRNQLSNPQAKITNTLGSDNLANGPARYC